MSERLHEVLAAITDAELVRVAAAVLGAEDMAVAGTAAPEKVVAANGDPRTLAVLRYAGTASVAGESRPWSAVAKVIELRVPGLLKWIRPAAEIETYRRRYFVDEPGGFRPARCYHITEPVEDVVVLWLEDLTGAQRAPFRFDHLARMVRHLGAWNARQSQPPPPPELGVERFSVFSRWSAEEWDLDGELADLRGMESGPEVQALYRGRSIDQTFALRDALLVNVEQARSLPRSLAFGDANVGNLFSTPTETIAVDWAGTTFDPLGVDAGSVIGSAITFGGDALAIARAEQQLFASYIDGLAAGGWSGERDDVRRAYFVHFGGYLLAQMLLPAFLKKFDRARIERRMGMPWAEIFPRHAGFIDLIPVYLDELRRLAG